MIYYSLARLISLSEKYANGKLENFAHIYYDPVLDEDNLSESIDGAEPKKYCDFRIIRAASHDGALLFTIELILNTFLPLVNKTACRTGKEGKKIMGYKIGKLRMDLENCPENKKSCFAWPHSHEITSLPVKVIYAE